MVTIPFIPNSLSFLLYLKYYFFHKRVVRGKMTYFLLMSLLGKPKNVCNSSQIPFFFRRQFHGLQKLAPLACQAEADFLGPGAFVVFHSFCLECPLPALPPAQDLVITHHPSKPDLTFLPPKHVLEFCTASSEEDDTHLHICLPTDLQDSRNWAPSHPHSRV